MSAHCPYDQDQHNEMCWHYYADVTGLRWDMSNCLNIPEHLRMVVGDRKRYVATKESELDYGPQN